MKKTLLFLIIAVWVMGSPLVLSQSKPASEKKLVEVYYFHPDERCPIDQSIEENTRKLMQSSFAKEIKDGTIKFQIINTDDKSKAGIVSRFEINAQALYVVKSSNGKELKNDLTHFAFSNGQSNPEKFRSGLKEEILKALR